MRVILAPAGAATIFSAHGAVPRVVLRLLPGVADALPKAASAA